MIKIGLTGGIGSGKTFISKIFEKINIPIYYADNEAKILLNKDKEIITQIKKRFGDDIYQNNGIDKAKLASVVFNSTEALNTINSIIHPKVRKYFALWAEKQTAPYVIMEAAILFETGGYKDMNFNVLVYAPEDLRIRRVMERDHTGIEQVKRRMRYQQPDEHKMEKADWVIYNNGDQMVLPQIIEIDKEIKEKI